MRALIPCALLFGAAHSDGEQFIPYGGKTLEEVYGPMAGVDKTIPWFDRGGLKRVARPQGYFDVRTEENCVFPIEVYFVQDETSSFTDNYKQMKDVELKKAFDAIRHDHPDSTFGVGTHRDIPIWTLGWKYDYCLAFQLPLSSNWTALYNTYDNLFSTGGGDAPEYQFGALIAAAESDKPGWRNPLATPLIVVSTDAQPHFEGDGFNRTEYGLGEYSGHFDEANPEGQCETQYYPSPKQVRDALTQREAYVAFLVFDGEFSQGGLPIDAWRWFNEYIEQGPEFVANVQAGAKDFWEKLSKVITELEKVECLAATTTLPPTTVTTPAPTVTTPAPTVTTPAPTVTTPAPTVTTPPPSVTTPAPAVTTRKTRAPSPTRRTRPIPPSN